MTPTQEKSPKWFKYDEKVRWFKLRHVHFRVGYPALDFGGPVTQAVLMRPILIPLCDLAGPGGLLKLCHAKNYGHEWVRRHTPSAVVRLAFDTTSASKTARFREAAPPKVWVNLSVFLDELRRFFPKRFDSMWDLQALHEWLVNNFEEVSKMFLQAQHVDQAYTIHPQKLKTRRGQSLVLRPQREAPAVRDLVEERTQEADLALLIASVNQLAQEVKELRQGRLEASEAVVEAPKKSRWDAAQKWAFGDRVALVVRTLTESHARLQYDLDMIRRGTGEDFLGFREEALLASGVDSLAHAIEHLQVYAREMKGG